MSPCSIEVYVEEPPLDPPHGSERSCQNSVYSKALIEVKCHRESCDVEGSENSSLNRDELELEILYIVFNKGGANNLIRAILSSFKVLYSDD